MIVNVDISKSECDNFEHTSASLDIECVAVITYTHTHTQFSGIIVFTYNVGLLCDAISTGSRYHISDSTYFTSPWYFLKSTNAAGKSKLIITAQMG